MPDLLSELPCHELVMVSGVSDLNNLSIGLFRTREIAEAAGGLMLAAEKHSRHPEWTGYTITHHAEIAAAVKKASMYDALRDADPDAGHPYIARERQDSWGNWKTEWLGGLEADRAIDTAMTPETTP
jgi:hypothetical protein